MSEVVNVRLVPNEEETAAERCSEKLVDLVVLLTTKLDNNVEDLRKELTDNINENIERFERVQQQQEEEYGQWNFVFSLRTLDIYFNFAGKLCLQLQLCNEENDRLNKMLGGFWHYKFSIYIISIFLPSENLTKDHNQTIQKYETLLGKVL